MPKFRSALAAAALFSLGASFASASSIAYPDQGPVSPGIIFTHISESSGTDAVPLFGPPTAFATGLRFNPMSFVSASTNGAADVTDGQLNFDVHGVIGPSQDIGIGAISLFEGGDYTLIGNGTAATSAYAGAIVHIMVTQINGVDVTPFALPAGSVSTAFNLVANPGLVQPWALGETIPISIAGVTGIQVVIDNQLDSISEPGTIAAISKKNFEIDVTPTMIPVPEPSTMILCMGAGLAGSTFLRRARRR